MATFGYCVEAPTDWSDLLGLATELDRNSRFDSFWLSDALMPNGPQDWPRLEAWTALAAIAHATSRLRLGVLVSGNAYRHPALLAKIVTTIDRISDGRVELGIGAGWPGENRRFGIDFWSRRERVERLEEAIQVIRLLWTKERPRFAGRYYRLDGPPYEPKNVQQPHPPILVGGGSDGMLRTIARYADKASPMIDVAEAKSKVAAYCGEAGRDPSEIRWIGGGSLSLNDDEAMQRRAAEYGAQLYGGSADEVMRSDLFGSLEKVREGVRRQLESGVDEIVVFQLPRVHLPSLLRFSEEVVPSSGGGPIATPA
jgi:alkanesulfonate monooxygenase SsuD/methylene tetrahydromethanopterin reductase-like flavin-dependent oxidoreductase (luciferase family)